MLLPESLITALERLPGIGPKSASRLAFYLLRAPDDVAQDLSTASANLKANTAFCQECFNITEAGRTLCEVCDSSRRDGTMICVVEEALDVLALERTGGFQGKYHVLQGVLVARVAAGGVKEIILATNPSMEGDTTAMYLQTQLKPLGVHITRLARGLPVGGDLEYADQNTLLRALSGRQEMS